MRLAKLFGLGCLTLAAACGAPEAPVATQTDDVIERGDVELLRGDSMTSLDDVLVLGDGDLVLFGQGHGKGELSFAGHELEPGLFVARLSPAYELRWVTSFTGSGIEREQRVVIAPDGALVVAGAFDGDLAVGDLGLAKGTGERGFVAKLDAETGAARWLSELAWEAGGAGEKQGVFRTGPAVSRDGAVFTAETNKFGETLRVTKRDGDSGEAVWQRDVAASGFGVTGGLATTPSGDLVIAGANYPYYDMGPTSAYADFGKGEVRSDAGYLVLLQLASDSGDIVNSATFEPPQETNSDLTTRFNDVVIGDDGAVYLGGLLDEATSFGGDALEPEGSFDGFVVKLEADFSYAWGNTFGGAGNQMIQRLALAGDQLLATADGDGGQAALTVLAFDAASGDGNVVDSLEGQGDAGGLAASADGETVWFTGLVYGEFQGETIPSTGLLARASR